ncbi:hypothetical protein BS47DRAFT_1360460 [Hydnum rufescens UP504]|uniref:Uncharacterized protein n=1 Tax=Hydnum rufescens UP504 TaxID=1448309 RepID=A0A9P6DYS3_9AGAM|nr:hypothetical protein BS47DRAFT_1360460 [Hydnum rufescens UP504]
MGIERGLNEVMGIKRGIVRVKRDLKKVTEDKVDLEYLVRVKRGLKKVMEDEVDLEKGPERSERDWQGVTSEAGFILTSEEICTLREPRKGLMKSSVELGENEL